MLLVGHLLALAVCGSVLDGWPLVMFVAGLVLSALLQLQEAMLRTPRAVRAISISPEGRLTWRDPKGDWHEARPGPDSYATPLLTILHLQPPSGAAVRAVLLPDSADAEDRRRLRVWLRWSASAPADGKPAS